MSLPFQNNYIHRRVAPASAKPCFICYRSSTSVLITPDNADWFYTCASHLEDRGFAAKNGPNKEDVEKERKEKLEKEMERVKKEWEEKEKKKKMTKEDGKDEEGKRKKDEKRGETKQEKDKEKEKEGDKSKKDDAQGKEKEATKPSGPDSYTLHKKIFEMRLNRLRQQQQAKRNLELLKSASLNVPKGDPV
ncbi:DUF1742-domain-containing protein [Ascodesmis nigricans]|uniref:DUF1742-domain-containing protein n=1 Tax=Ascodesmis nigricans TaxID=341454 RepID=A0A4S2N4P6_9PEZI|nr:DUF1742-domain-containing protein [Ascodesmis nigricans]